MKKVIKIFMFFTCINSSTALAACDEKIVESSPSSSFILNGGEAYDQKTELTWSRCSLGTTWMDGAGCVGTVKLMRLDEAKRTAQSLGADWHIPTIEELYSILEQKCTEPAINTTVFPSVKNFSEGAPYWTDTRIEDIPSLIYYIDFFNGGIDGHTKGFPLAVRLVRSGK